MKHNQLKMTLSEGKAVIGPFVKMSDPAIIEIVGISGFDFVIIDLEHGPHSIESAQNLIRAAEAKNICPILRITDNHPSHVLRALDIGAHGVQVPQISSKKDAEELVHAAKYHPEGERGMCRYVRAADYSGLDKFEYFKVANEESLLIVHIEGMEGINNLEVILDEEKLDIIFLGPYDLSQSCGVPGQVDHPLVEDKMKEAVKLAQKQDKYVGTFVETIDSAKKWVNIGVKYIAYSVDVGIFHQACSEITRKFKSS